MMTITSRFVSLLVLPLVTATLLAAPEEPPKATKKSAAPSPDKSAADSEAFFNSAKIPRVDITIGLTPGFVKPLGPLLAEPRKYIKATLTVDGKVYPDVGIHLRGGSGSFRQVTEKAGFTISMGKFGGKEKFHGMSKWHLANSAQDGSYLSELVCGELLHAAGAPAARIQHAIVSVNGQMRGFYYLKEGYDSQFLKRHFKNADGNFYDGGFLRDVDQPLELTSSKDDVKDWADLKALTAAAREPDPQKRFEGLEKLLDMDAFINAFVVLTIVGDWDGYIYNRNNYRVYHHPKLDKITFIPSGMDQEFFPVRGHAASAEQVTALPPIGPNPWAGPRTPQGLVAQAVYSTPEGKARYVKRLTEINRTLMDPEKWNKRLDELQARLQPEIAKVDPAAGANYPNEVKRIRNFFNVRSKAIERQLK